jgi:metal-sulfur cluster biosynthetic enzyme
MKITSTLVREKLREKMIDPELNINVVDLGLVYDIKVIPRTRLTSFRALRARKRRASVRGSDVSTDFSEEKSGFVRILMTLTTPGCPLAAVFGPMVRQALSGIPGLDPYKDVEIELTFDPPWHQGMMSERAKAEMGVE